MKGGNPQMEKIYHIGLDVHKRRTTYAVRDWDGTLIAKGSTATSYSDLKDVLNEYLSKCKVIMEACTSYYHLYKEMKNDSIEVSVANMIQLRKLVAKNDPLDAKRLADMSRFGTLPESYIPEDKIQKLRGLVNIYHQGVKETVRLSNQLNAALDRNGTRITSKTSLSRIWWMEVVGCLSQDDPALRYLAESLRDVNERVVKIRLEMIEYAKRNFNMEFELLKTIPGIGDVIATYLISEICPISRFGNKKKLRRYAGVVPVKEISDKKVYASYLPKHASRNKLRYALGLAANCITKKKDGRLKEYYKKKKKGHTRKHALMCVASSLSDIVFNVLKHKKPYEINDQPS